MPSSLASASSDRVRLRPVFEAFGWVFCLAWAGALAAFPAQKGVASGYVPVIVGLMLGLWSLRSRLIHRVVQWIGNQSTGAFLLMLLTTATVLRAVAIAYFPLDPLVDDAQFHRYAVAMLAGQGYGMPGRLAFFPPGMSLILAAWYSLTGTSPAAGKLLHLLIADVLVWQTWVVGRHVLPERVARVSALLVAVFPTLVFYTATLGYETLLGLVLLLVYRLALRVGETSSSTRLTLVGIGTLLGVGALLKPICLLIPIVLGAGWWALRTRLTVAVARVGLVSIMMVLVISPWMWRNYRVLNAVIPISTNGGYTLYAANNPKATGLATTPADPLPGEAGEVSTDRLRMRAALSWILQNPGRVLTLALVKVVYTWGTTSSIMAVVSTDRLPPTAEAVCKGVLNVAWTSLLVWCCATTATRRVWGAPRLVPATLMIAYIFALHLFYEANSRHHIPILPLLIMIGAVSLCREETPHADGARATL